MFKAIDAPAAGAKPRRTPLTREQVKGFWAVYAGWVLDGVDSVIWYDPSRDAALVRSAAGLAVLRHLGGGWGVLAAIGGLVPRGLRDAIYNTVARNRHRLAGEACLIPTASERARFLD